MFNSPRQIKVLLACSLSSLAIILVTLLLLLGVALVLAQSDETADTSPNDATTVVIVATASPRPLVVAQVIPTQIPSSTPNTSSAAPTATIIPSPTRTPSPTITPRGTLSESASAATPAPADEAASSSAEVVINDTTSCLAHTASQAYANVRKYPTLNSEVISYIEPGRLERVIAFSRESDGTWYGVPSGWVSESVINVTGSNCRSIPDASGVLWNQSLGHVDHQLRSYRLVTNIKVEEYMRKYPMLVFSNGTIWYNPSMQQ